MKVDRDKALTARLEGRTYYFCSEHCLHVFRSQLDAGAESRTRAPDPLKAAGA
jgi:hypothetical protein